MLDVDVLDSGAEVGEAPGDVVVVADDDEGNAGEGDSGDVEIAGGGGGLEVGLVPDAGDAVGEVRVLGEERLAGGGVGSGDDPVVGAGEAAFADGVAEGLLEGEEVLGSGGVGIYVFTRVWLPERRKCGRAGFTPSSKSARRGPRFARYPHLRIEIRGTRICRGTGTGGGR